MNDLDHIIIISEAGLEHKELMTFLPRTAIKECIQNSCKNNFLP